jgi:hypothetical protein
MSSSEEAYFSVSCSLTRATITEEELAAGK